jgi:Tfp pilus assembly protein PilO
MKLIYKKNLTTVALIWAGCFILIFLVYMLVLVPQSTSKKNIENDLAKTERQYQFALKAAEEGPKIQLKKQIEELRNKLGDFVVDIEGSANLTFDIGKIAREQNIASFSIEAKGQGVISDIPDCTYIGESHINISFTGQFNQFVVFLNTLERHRPVIFVDEFTVTRSRSQDKSEHQASFNVAVFVKK